VRRQLDDGATQGAARSRGAETGRGEGLDRATVEVTPSREVPPDRSEAIREPAEKAPRRTDVLVMTAYSAIDTAVD
jgi:hypothetical protein